MAWRRLQAPRAEMFCHPPFKNSERTCPAAVRPLRHKRLYRPHHQHQTVRPIQNFSSSRFSSSKPRGRCFDALPAAVAKSLSSGIIQQCSPRRQPRHTATDHHTLRRLSLSDPATCPATDTAAAATCLDAVRALWTRIPRVRAQSPLLV